MKLLVISSAPIVHIKEQYFLYAPYEKEMKLWAKHANSIQFCCPIWKEDKELLIAPISFKIDSIIELKEFDTTSFVNTLKAFNAVFVSMIQIYKAIKKADHIHLRCPGNMALLASFIQILFPKKKKTAKYAGNWDPKSKQPISYKIQKWILSNTFLTKNMQVLVYGEWENQTKNIKPFFTATYNVSEINDSRFEIRELDKGICFLFVGALVKGKQPLYAVKLVYQLSKQGYPVTLELYGEGLERKKIEQFIDSNNLQSIVVLKGNQPKEIVKQKYKDSHFLILPSKSEGWPKAVAEAMFWGCVPIATRVSCVPYMLAEGIRGVLLDMNLHKDIDRITALINNKESYIFSSKSASEWSRKYTIDYFECEIQKLIKL